MFGKWRYAGSALVVALGVAVMPLHAQRGQGFRGQGLRAGGGPKLGHSLELALENEGALEISQDQAAELQELKAIIDGDVAGLAEEMRALRASIQSGEVERDEGFRQMGLSGENGLRRRRPSEVGSKRSSRSNSITGCSLWSGRAVPI